MVFNQTDAKAVFEDAKVSPTAGKGHTWGLLKKGLEYFYILGKVASMGILTWNT